MNEHVVHIDNRSSVDNWIVNETDIPITVACDELQAGKFSVNLQPGQRQRVAPDIQAEPYPFGKQKYDQFHYQLNRSETWKVYMASGKLVMAVVVDNPDSGAGADIASEAATEGTIPRCAECHRSFAWEEAYLTQDTPGSAPFAPPGHGDGRPRIFCPHCGALVVDWLVTREQDFDRWTWYGNNEATNRNVSLPPSPWVQPPFKGIPVKLHPTFSAPVLNVEEVKEWERMEGERENANFMSATDSSFEALQATPAQPFLSRLLGVFIEPGETFEDIARKPDWIAPLILLILVALAVVETLLVKIGASELVLHSLEQSGRAASMDPGQLSQMAERSASIMRFVMPLSAALGTPIFLLAVAGFGLLVLNGFFGQHAKFKDVFSVTCYADLPSIVGAVMAIVVVLFGDPAAFNPQSPAPTNPAYFMNPLTSSRAVMALATSLDVIIFWFLVLLAIGLSRVVQKRVKAGTIFITYLGAWALLVIVKVGFAMLFGGH